MRVTLVHNPDAGSGDHVGEDLLTLLQKVGHDAVYTSTEGASLIRALEQRPDVVLAAGGDGTVGAVARLMAAHAPDVPLSILPVGTANNLAASLGIHGEVDKIVSGLDSHGRRRLDVPSANAAWGSARFVESAGLGAFATMLRDAARDEWAGSRPSGPRPGGRGARFRKVLARTHPRHWHVTADGDDLSGDYLLVMALNTARVGPSFVFAPDADPGDGRLELLLVREDDRETLGGYLDSLSGRNESALRIPTRAVREVRLGWSADHGHLDDHLWPEGPASRSASGRNGIVEIEVGHRSVQILVPQSP